MNPCRGCGTRLRYDPFSERWIPITGNDPCDRDGTPYAHEPEWPTTEAAA